jgi:predicted dehydrogenase
LTGNVYYHTDWRKNPTHQGGFLLDGGVHYAAAIRLLLGEAAVDTVIAYSTLINPHLPPIDSVHAVIRTKTGAVGSFAAVAGSTLKAFEFGVGCEQGSVVADSRMVKVSNFSQEQSDDDVHRFEPTSGVKEEVKAWAEALAAGKPNPLQYPEEALADLELLETMFRSGEQGGAPQELHFQ